MNCVNYGKSGHFAHDCTELKVIYDQIHFHNALVSSFLMLTETCFLLDYRLNSNQPHSTGSQCIYGFSSNFEGK